MVFACTSHFPHFLAFSLVDKIAENEYTEKGILFADFAIPRESRGDTLLSGVKFV
ncbi:MAG: hypothetical protein ACKVHR_11600 [Pirellulales bacterium]